MVKIHIGYMKQSGKKLYKVKMEGHATGSQDTCTACSAIISALIGAVENSGTKKKDITQASSGMAYVEALCDEKLEGAFEMALIGFLQIEKASPEYVSVNR